MPSPDIYDFMHKHGIHIPLIYAFFERNVLNINILKYKNRNILMS